MSGALVALVLGSVCVSVLAPMLVVTALAGVIFGSGAALPLSAPGVFLVVGVVGAIPAAAYLSAVLIRPLTQRGLSASSALELLAPVLVAALALQDAAQLPLFARILSGEAGTIEAFSLILSRVVMCAAAVALVLSCIYALSELVVAWGARALGIRYPVVFAAMGQVLLLFVVAAGVDLFVGFFGRELAPLSILRGIVE